MQIALHDDETTNAIGGELPIGVYHCEWTIGGGVDLQRDIAGGTHPEYLGAPHADRRLGIKDTSYPERRVDATRRTELSNPGLRATSRDHEAAVSEPRQGSDDR